jgi:hypothetical protein
MVPLTSSTGKRMVHRLHAWGAWSVRHNDRFAGRCSVNPMLAERSRAPVRQLEERTQSEPTGAAARGAAAIPARECLRGSAGGSPQYVMFAPWWPRGSRASDVGPGPAPTPLASARCRSQLMWFAADVIGPFLCNVVSFSRNVVPDPPIFSANLVPKPPM